MPHAAFGHNDVTGEIRIAGQCFKILAVGRIDYQHDIRRIDSLCGPSAYVSTGLTDITFSHVCLQPAFALSDVEWALVSAIASTAGTAKPRAYAPQPVPKKALKPGAIATAARVFLEGEAARDLARWSREYYD